MDHIDIDQILEVPDTPPDKIVTRNEQLRNFSPTNLSRNCKSSPHVNPIVISSGDASSSKPNRHFKRNITSNTLNKKPLLIPSSPSKAPSKAPQVTINSISPSKGIRHKRLVRNGCINPVNIAKGKQSVEKDNSTPVPVVTNAIDIDDDDNSLRSLKGKGVIDSSFSKKQKPIRSSLIINEKANESEGWRNTHNQNMNNNNSQSRKNKGVLITEDPISKRHKHVSTSSSTSRSTADNDLNIESPVQRRKSRSNQNNVDIFINLDSTPEVQRVDENNTAQLEMDEMLARELQEQFYNEQHVLGSEQIDEHLAMALQQEEESRRRAPVSTRGRSSRGGASSSRLASLRSSFQGQSRTLSSTRGRGRGRNSVTSSSRQRNNPVFPANMDIDMRMHILEALESLESFGDIGMANRDFNENDYEMLLALDENNHQHSGANTRNINELPQSTVQNDNLEEACAICLDNPTVGDTIRHLPCFHKFHKDCIDPWLKRKPNCPVCKSSIS